MRHFHKLFFFFLNPLLFELHWVFVKFRVEYKLDTLTFNCFGDFLLPYHSSILTIYQPSHSIPSSNEDTDSLKEALQKPLIKGSFIPDTAGLEPSSTVQLLHISDFQSHRFLLKTHHSLTPFTSSQASVLSILICFFVFVLLSVAFASHLKLFTL